MLRFMVKEPKKSVSTYSKRRLTILSIAFMVMLLTMMFLAFYSITQIQKLHQHTKDIINHPLLVSHAMRDIAFNTLSMRSDMKEVSTSSDLIKIKRLHASIDKLEQQSLRLFGTVTAAFLGDQHEIIKTRTMFTDWHARFHHVDDTALEDIETLITRMQAHTLFADTETKSLSQSALAIEASTMKELLLLFALLLSTIITASMFIIRHHKKHQAEIDSFKHNIKEHEAHITILESEHQNMLENIQDCLYRTDAEGRLIFASPSIETLMCCKPHEMIGDFLSDYYIDPNGRQQLLTLLLSSPKGSVSGFETRVRRKDNTIIWLSANSHFIYDDTGNINGVEGTLRDITAIKETESTLRKLSQAIEQAGESIIITDTAGIIEYANPAFTLLTGYSSQDAIGNNPRFLRSGNEKSGIYSTMWKTITSGHTWHGKVIDKKKDGSFFPASLTISPIFDNEKTITHFVGIHSDLTQVIQLEQQSQQSQKMESIGTLVGGIAHDFNNILASITGAIFLAKRELGENRHFTSIEQQAARAADIVKKLLAFARKGVQHIEPMPLANFFVQNTELFEAAITRNTRLTLNICQEEITIKGDANQLQQVIISLIQNAQDALIYTASPSITLQLCCKQPPKHLAKEHMLEDKFACIMVSDNGHGIKNDDIHKIFEPFFTTKDVDKGTGLGLSMVKGTVQSHHGLIDIQSTVGEGTTMSIYLPLLTTSPHSHDSTETAEQNITTGAGELILVVDDEETLRAVNCAIIESLGYHTIEAADGLQAIQQFNRHKKALTLVIMDVVMPRMGGIRAAEQIRQISETVPILFATGYDKSQVLGEIHTKIPHSTIMTKPFSADDLHRQIHKIIAKHNVKEPSSPKKSTRV